MTVMPNSTAARDIAYHLHPYTNAVKQEAEGSLVLTRGKGIYVYDEEGKEYIEGLAGLWCTSLGFNEERLVEALETLDDVRAVHLTRALDSIFGKRIIVVGGGAQVAQVALGAVSEADRHNLRGERISVDTIPLVGEEHIAAAVRAVADLPRARLLVLAGSIMGGDISVAADELRSVGIPIIALNMVGSITEHVDLVVSDPVQAGTMAVMAVADTATFDLGRQRGRRY